MTDDELTIDALAAASGVPSRTIRFYQAKGLLPDSIRRGRVAVYGPEHIDRLRTIAELQDRGLRLRAIRELLSGVERSDFSLEAWLGVGERLAEPWSEDQPMVLSESELKDMVGGRPGLLAALQRSGLIEQQGRSVVLKSPTLVRIAARLLDVGVDPESALTAERIIRRRLSKAADELVDHFTALFADSDLAPDAEALSALLDTLRPVSTEAVQLIFAQEIERALRELVERGGTIMKARSRHRQRR